METFSEDLRRERERQGISIDTISESTKVSVRYLNAIEAGDFFDLPGGVIRKGMLRAYLDALHLDPSPWLDRFEAMLERELSTSTTADAGLQQFADNVRRCRPDPPATPTGTRWLGVALMALLLVAFGWCVWRFVLRGRVSLAGGREHTPALSLMKSQSGVLSCVAGTLFR